MNNFRKFKNFVWGGVIFIVGKFFPKFVIDYNYKQMLGYRMNWKNPTDINEKIQWLKIYGDKKTWSICADKYKVREYVAERGLANYLVPLLGVWDKAEDINWEKLPIKFVMRVNNGSGDTLVCKDKSQINCQQITEQLNKLLKTRYGLTTGEPHYISIKPRIIAEEMLDCSCQPIPSTSLIDYKIWCFDGVPKYIWCCFNRTKDSTEVGVYDLEWNYLPHVSVFTSHYKNSRTIVPRPNELDEMLSVASILSKGHPVVRIDLYDVNSKVYFGEMTFTSLGGYMNFYSREFLKELGGYIQLPLHSSSNRKNNL